MAKLQLLPTKPSLPAPLGLMDLLNRQRFEQDEQGRHRMQPVDYSKLAKALEWEGYSINLPSPVPRNAQELYKENLI